MNRLICFISILVLAAVTVGVALPVQANTIGPITTSTPIPYTLTDWPGTLTFPKFDSTLGTLTEVDVFLSSGMETTLTVTNLSPDGSSGWAKTEVQVTVHDPANEFPFYSNNFPQIDFYSPEYDYSLPGNGTITSGLLTKTGSDTEDYTLSNILTEFTGGPADTIVLSASTFTQDAPIKHRWKHECVASD